MSLALRSCSVLLFALVLGACAADDAPAVPDVLDWQVSEISSPAGPESGEPFLSATSDRLLMSWLEATDGGHELRFSELGTDGFGEIRTIVQGDRFFVNWADFPSLTVTEDGQLWAHWLQRGPGGGYDYGVRVARSDDGGVSWSEPWSPHDDTSATEHGFVSTVAMESGGVGFVWLDGRAYAEGADGSPATQEMSLRFRQMSAAGVPGQEMVIDARVCDCCQTDAAVSGSTPVVVYRDRTPEEIRDIYITRLVDGAWTPGVPVHDDGWEIGGCPVNGPAVVAEGDAVTVAWFTAVGDVPRVKLAHSTDGGVTFGAPIQIDDGDPGGRVDLLAGADGSVIVSWLERTGGDGAEVRVRQVGPDGTTSSSLAVAGSTEGRGSGFARLAWAPDGRLLVAWTDAEGERVRVAALGLGEG